MRINSDSFRRTQGLFTLCTRRISILPGFCCMMHGQDFPVWMHTGHTAGHAAIVALAPRTHTAVVVLSNSAIGTGELGLLILRMINK